MGTREQSSKADPITNQQRTDLNSEAGIVSPPGKKSPIVLSTHPIKAGGRTLRNAKTNGTVKPSHRTG